MNAGENVYDTTVVGTLPSWSLSDPFVRTPIGRRWQVGNPFNLNVPPNIGHGGVRLGGDENLYVGSAILHNMVIPGKVHNYSSLGCYYALNGKEIMHTERYDILPVTDEMHWVLARGGDVPLGAVAGGYEANGEISYHARMRYGRDLIPGKLVPSQGHAAFGSDWLEHPRQEYEVLCWKYGKPGSDGQFNGSGQDAIGPFTLRGYLNADNSVFMMKSHFSRTTIYIGRYDSTSESIHGQWGASVSSPEGVFYLNKSAHPMET